MELERSPTAVRLLFICISFNALIAIMQATSLTILTSYFQTHTPAKTSLQPALNKLFDTYRGMLPYSTCDLTDFPVDDTDDPDQIGADGTMKYLEDLSVSLEEPVMLAVLAQVKAPTMGELSRGEFTNGWEAVSADTISKQASVASQFRESLKSDANLFRNVYKHSFVLARQPGQKSVLIEAAVEFWRMLFSPAGFDWTTKGFNWIETYLTFIQEKWNKSISKDLWDQTLFFAKKTREDPSLAWWNEAESAWPSIIDEFAKHVKSLPEHRKITSADTMDTS